MRKYSWLELGGVAVLVAALVVLLYREFAREPDESERRKRTFEAI